MRSILLAYFRPPDWRRFYARFYSAIPAPVLALAFTGGARVHLAFPRCAPDI